jgi:allantoinase
MPPDRRPGMDHDHYDWSPIATRQTLRWPGDARVALCVIVNLEHMEWRAPPGSFQPPGLYSHLAMQRPLAEFWTVSHREYGHRVGIFRILDVLRRHGIPATIAIDAMTARHYGYLVKHCVAAGCEMIAHGIAVTRMITSRMGEAEERDYIRDAVDAVGAATGRTPIGWHGPEYGQSARTPTLLAEAGLRYVCDWANDEQPYRLKTERELYALPIMIELDDVFALRDRKFRVDEYTAQITEAFDTIYREAANTGKTFVLNLHPWLTGQPFRIGFLDAALAHIAGRPGVWKATGSQIIEAYRQRLPT